MSLHSLARFTNVGAFAAFKMPGQGSIGPYRSRKAIQHETGNQTSASVVPRVGQREVFQPETERHAQEHNRVAVRCLVRHGHGSPGSKPARSIAFATASDMQQ